MNARGFPEYHSSELNGENRFMYADPNKLELKVWFGFRKNDTILAYPMGLKEKD